jgi:hypothetical protein
MVVAPAISTIAMPFQLHSTLFRSALCSMLLFASLAHAQAEKPSDVIYRLYQQYAWEALFAAPAEGGAALKPGLLAEPKKILATYFDDGLVRLLLKERACLAHHPGELCKLEFNPIFASQDPAASDLLVQSTTPEEVAVQFTYPADRTTVRLVYRMVHTRTGWRIKDIAYPAGQLSLVAILAEK